jgi:predicted nucleic acid-binding protein
MAYLDTSVLVAYYCPESLSAAVQSAIVEDADPAISRLVEVEFAAALAMKVRVKEVDEAVARQILGLFAGHLDKGHYRIVPIEQPEYDLAFGWIGQFAVPLRAPDALHLAAALAHGLTLVTADRPLAYVNAVLEVQ